MKKAVKIILFIIVTLVIIFGAAMILNNRNKNNMEAKINIIATNFPGYDFARAVTKNSETVNVKMLLKPGAESHDFEPTPQDIKDIKNSEMFIYVGGESDTWIQNILNDIDTEKTKIIKLMGLVDVVTEEIVDGMEEENGEDEIEYDEHVWTSPVNAITIINKLKNEIIKIDGGNQELYEKNAGDYIRELAEIDAEIRNVIKNSERKEIVFGDRFPLRYFADEYGLKYFAAFPGCSEQTEASAKTIAFLINKILDDAIPVVFKIELSDGKIADAIAEETDAKVLEFNAAHNISQKDFDAGVTYAKIMKNNVEVLREALK